MTRCRKTDGLLASKGVLSAEVPAGMRLDGMPLADMTEPQLADYAHYLIVDLGLVPWGNADG